MDPVGIVGVAFGLLIILTRGPLAILPAQTFRLLTRITSSTFGTRMMGLTFTILIIPTVYFTSQGNSDFASFLYVLCVAALLGWVVALLMFPSIYMLLIEGFLPSESDSDLFGWRLLGLVSVGISVVLVYFGMQHL
jgi:hypothetical protein